MPSSEYSIDIGCPGVPLQTIEREWIRGPAYPLTPILPGTPLDIVDRIKVFCACGSGGYRSHLSGIMDECRVSVEGPDDIADHRAPLLSRRCYIRVRL